MADTPEPLVPFVPAFWGRSPDTPTVALKIVITEHRSAETTIAVPSDMIEPDGSLSAELADIIAGLDGGAEGEMPGLADMIDTPAYNRSYEVSERDWYPA